MAPPEVADAVRRQGGRLFVWPRRGRCCQRGLVWLETGQEPNPVWEYQEVPAQGFSLYLARMGRVPDELHLDVSAGRRGQRVSAYWDNCAYLV